MVTSSFATFLAAAVGSKLLQAVTIMGGTFILEDAATLLAAMQVAAGGLSLPLALGALYAGIVLGDLGLYLLGYLSAKHAWAKRLVPPRRKDIGHNWVSQRVVPLVIVSRFVPGLRLPTYTTMGFLRAPLQKFTIAAIGATLVWTSCLFFISLKLGVLLMSFIGIWRWAGLGVFCIVLVLVGRLAARFYNKRSPL